MQDFSHEKENIEQTADWVIVPKEVTRQRKAWAEYAQQPGKRTKDLFKDRFMRFFVNEQSLKVAASKLDKLMHLSLAIRTKKFRQIISHCIKHQKVSQVIILGSGKDTLAIHKRNSQKWCGIKIFEIDRKSVLDAKERIVKEKGENINAVYIRIDYTKDNFIAYLRDNGFNFTETTVILWEGNILYLEQEDINKVFRLISENFEHVFIAFDYLHKDVLENYKEIDEKAGKQSFTKMREEFQKSGAIMKTGLSEEDIKRLSQAYKFEIVSSSTISDLAKQYQVDEDPYYTSSYHHLTLFSK